MTIKLTKIEAATLKLVEGHNLQSDLNEEILQDVAQMRHLLEEILEDRDFTGETRELATMMEENISNLEYQFATLEKELNTTLQTFLNYVDSRFDEAGI